jgi:hypothetical protein
MTRIGWKPGLPVLLSMRSKAQTPGTASRVQRVVEKPILVTVGDVASERKPRTPNYLETAEPPWSDV